MNETVAIVGDIYRMLATGKETNGAYALIDARVFPGGGPPPHVHSREEEGFYVLEGEVAFYKGEERIVAKAGDSVHLLRGEPHRFKNETAEMAKMLIWVAPAGAEQMFLEIGEAVEDLNTPPKITEKQIAHLMEVALKKYGIEILT
ncbi:MAG: cupin domain-containing protein [Candidatus Omnitrophica bacterium]|nr:cupin domain-containing protein [Candidatus Omnitrophota bacterium]MCA9427471.1 cupin domain-containing protein [Candidatus Omnitrophota bacterium]MCA9431717.1 cupin domain-containing protein [Candidatus Omnitrophota bacterium]MCA9448831.1 cupin domain-containing protein [Candidatus Omnitrophota bacterium]MCB9770243.1 cupin domain-containing protein [Candidatus Omnitrophota bacterium]